MNIALINGSPKSKDSASGVILEELGAYLSDHTVTEIGFHAAVSPTQAQLELLAGQDALIFAFPLYVDGIPAHLLRALVEAEAFLKARPAKRTAFAVVNCGFFEGIQCKNALDQMKSWSEKANAAWGQGVGLGGGGMLLGLSKVPYGKGPRKNASLALGTLSKNAAALKTDGDLFVRPNFPRFLYKTMAEVGWRAQIKQNGLKPRDLSLQK